MIVYDLKCRKDHVFEAWFPDSASFAEQAESGKVLCPVCGSSKVTKALMAPNLMKGTRGEAERPCETSEVAVADTEKAAELRGLLRGLREQVESNCDYVGEDFAEEARKIHYGETDARGIYGDTSDEEAKELQDEGIDVQRVPWLRRDNS